MSAVAHVRNPFPAAAPLVSILIPSFNAGRFLRTALDSIIAQDWRPLEIVVADGGSTDETITILREYEMRHPNLLRWLSEPDKGPADAVNKTLALARGEYASVMSADDFYYPGVIRQAIELMQHEPAVGLVYGDVAGVDEQGQTLYLRHLPEFSWEAFFGISCCLPQGSIFFRMTVAHATGSWNPSYYSCDLDYWMRLCFRTQARHLPVTVSAWRRYAEQRTRPDRFAKIWYDYWRMIDESPDICAASPRLRRLAHASQHLFAMRFHPTGNRWSVAAHLLKGLVLHPTYWRYNPWQRTLAALPGGRAGLSWYRALRGQRV